MESIHYLIHYQKSLCLQNAVRASFLNGTLAIEHHEAKLTRPTLEGAFEGLNIRPTVKNSSITTIYCFCNFKSVLYDLT